VGQSEFWPQGISVVPRIRPKMKPNSSEINMPNPRQRKPTLWKDTKWKMENVKWKMENRECEAEIRGETAS